MSLTKLSKNWEALCLLDNPFAGDFGEPGDRVLSDKMVTARKGGACHTCKSACVPGTRIRVRVEIFDGEVMRFRWCQACCRAMAVYGQRPSILERRIAAGIKTTEGT